MSEEEAEKLCALIKGMITVPPNVSGKGRIKVGAPIFQDMHFGKWPDHADPPMSWGERAIDPDMIFEVEWNGHSWDCKADGFGYQRDKGEYGNGSIFVTGYENVVMI